MVSISQLNPLQSIGIGSIGLVVLIMFLAILVIGLIGFGVYMWIRKKQLKYSIPLHKKIGNHVIKVGVYKAKDFKIGMAGDKLWYIPSLKKYISPATLQTGNNEYTHFEREDGEWINVSYPDIDEKLKEMNVKYVDQDMRSQRIAIGGILEQRFQGKKGWWEKYGHLLTHIIFYFIVCVALVIIFYQFGTIVDKVGSLLNKVIEYEQLKCPSAQTIIPALAPLMLWRKK